MIDFVGTVVTLAITLTALFLYIIFISFDIAPQGSNPLILINECELHLPRTQTCELVAVPKEVE